MVPIETMITTMLCAGMAGAWSSRNAPPPPLRWSARGNGPVVDRLVIVVEGCDRSIFNQPVRSGWRNLLRADTTGDPSERNEERRLDQSTSSPRTVDDLRRRRLMMLWSSSSAAAAFSMMRPLVPPAAAATAADEAPLRPSWQSRPNSADLPDGLLEARVTGNVLSPPPYGMERDDIYYPT